MFLVDDVSGYGPSSRRVHGEARLTTQYWDLNALHSHLPEFQVLAFPSNQFGKQEPGSKEEILPGLKHVRPGKGFEPNFPIFKKGDVNGAEEQPLYTYLKTSCPPVGDSFGNPHGRLFYEPLRLSDVKWNFEKFLVSAAGRPVRRYAPLAPMSAVRRDIIAYLSSSSSSSSRSSMQQHHYQQQQEQEQATHHHHHHSHHSHQVPHHR
ncbi:unnamed protein product [Lampetra fluviatilis]